ncbi:undecaprenyl-phosphate alpha-N-acetylglucosaminyl 1-phosphate transferase [Desulfuribacillus stibiiarsenatis]|uniref:Undecaprenyl-phosphate alpha-N-acetylglucosaminyl 1-phosphate transferase n=1 Tax=Desulfuribacillus stibiiarsenatis TaxID=1390249 RepID=A0A1E5L9K1_9FIRM|nr:MraY family glycosyltransferase [Desulfuribacillus stibiiarsenatis]OEH86714.1 undecaprenyl-phosphate alpha-N-acetylglucosaminyl 1-phosphate transferase [Desulfuribacillus stibiiarsenatis]
MNTLFAYAGLFLMAISIALIATPLVKKLAILVGAVDQPDPRKVHTKIMPRMGGLAVYIAFMVTLAFELKFNIININSVLLNTTQFYGFLLGGTIIIIIGLIDDRYQISAKYKFLGQIIAAGVVMYAGIKVQFITLPFEGTFEFGWFSIPFTLLWIIGVTNALNLIDGLDGLAAGVASIALATVTIIGFAMGNTVVAFMALLLLGSTLGFLRYNFFPAKIFMGDTGALFLGYNLAIFSILGFKHVTLVSFIIPILILGVPIADTLFAILRRYLSKQPISIADKNHLHHCLLKKGWSHRTTVLIIYGISIFFSLTAIIFSQAEVWVAFTVLGVLFVITAIGAESINILNTRRQPIIHFIEDLVKYADTKQSLDKQNLKG